MKKILSLLLAGCLAAVCLAGCGNPAQKVMESVLSQAGAGGENAKPADANTPGGGVSTATKSYSEAYTLMSNITSGISDVIDAALAKHNESLDSDDPESLSSVIAMYFLSIDFAFTASLNEEATEEILGAAFSFLQIEDFALTKNAPHDYTLRFTGASEGNQFEMHAQYDVGTGALRYVETKDGALKEFVEFVPLGNGRYVLQNNYQRGVVEYDGSKVKSFTLSSASGTLEEGEYYTPEQDGVYPGGAGADAAWVVARGDDLAQRFVYDGSSLQIDTVDFMGSKKDMTIPA
ncbi:MAG: hypothetical protein GXY32_07120 [Ruminococcaceae bacterium]|nr:hypothetical protein [Oscillospiraceae bacterium]